MIKLAKFTVRAYASVWFAARRHPRVTDAPRHVHNWMKAILKFDEKTVEVIRPIFENGTYWQHSENVLLAALAD